MKHTLWHALTMTVVGAMVASGSAAMPLTAQAKTSTTDTLIAQATYCPYTTRGVYDRLRIRSGPGTNYRIVGYWYPRQVKLMQEPAILANGFRAFSSSRNQWVSTQYIIRTSGRCAQ